MRDMVVRVRVHMLALERIFVCDYYLSLLYIRLTWSCLCGSNDTRLLNSQGIAVVLFHYGSHAEE